MDLSTAMATALVLGKLLVWLAHNPAAVVALLALLSGLPTFVLTRNAALYANFDTLYQNVLQMGLQNAAFRNPSKTSDYSNESIFSPDVRAAYETYAYMVFNVCETIADGLRAPPEAVYGDMGDHCSLLFADHRRPPLAPKNLVARLGRGETTAWHVAASPEGGRLLQARVPRPDG